VPLGLADISGSSWLAACSTKAQLEDLIWFLPVEERGDSRIYFVGRVLRLGGERGLEIVEGLRGDAVLGREATALTDRRRKRKRLREASPSRVL
jgi:hypothetical protein